MMEQLEQINQSMFLMINAPADFAGVPLLAAIILSKGAVLALAALLIIAWFRAMRSERHYLIFIVMVALLALSINYVVGLVFPHPRPFMIGLGHTFLYHSAETSFPSDHATLMWTFALGLLWRRPLRVYGLIVAILAALTSWVRVFLGVHFPFDILGSMVVATLVIAALAPLQSRILQAIAFVFTRLNTASDNWMVRRKL